jgi:hypothetical protein
MKTVAHFRFTEDEKRMLNEYYMPLHWLCRDTETAEKAARLVRGDLDTYSSEQVRTIVKSATDLYHALAAQSSEAFWGATGLPYADELAQMRVNEAMKVIKLLESLSSVKV